jgi:DNA-binding NtrC family response regulator
MRHTALLLHAQEELMAILDRDLRALGFGTVRAQTCAEALRILASQDAPSVVFSDLTVADGAWTDVLAIPARCKAPINLVVVSGVYDPSLYAAAIHSGAFDFIVPPFKSHDLNSVFRCAFAEASSQRERALHAHA